MTAACLFDPLSLLATAWQPKRARAWDGSIHSNGDVEPGSSALGDVTADEIQDNMNGGARKELEALEGYGGCNFIYIFLRCGGYSRP